MTSAFLVIDIQAALCTGDWAAFDIDRVIDRFNPLARQARAADLGGYGPQVTVTPAADVRIEA